MASAELTVIVPLRPDDGDLTALDAYRRVLDARGTPYEMVLVYDRRWACLAEKAGRIRASCERVRLLGLSRWTGEAAAVAAALEHGRGEVVLTLPGHAQVAPDEIDRVLDGLDDADLVTGVRRLEDAPRGQRLQARLFHGLMDRLFGITLHDIGCRLRAMRRPVLEESQVYGTQWRFLPLIAARRGWRVREVDVAPGASGRFARLSPLDYPRRFFDLLSLFLLLKFTKRPLRFFGPIGFGVLGFGTLAMAGLIASRLWFEVPLGDRPALVLAVLMIVLGIQVIAIGLIAEIIIFTHGRQIRDHAVAEVVGGARG